MRFLASRSILVCLHLDYFQLMPGYDASTANAPGHLRRRQGAVTAPERGSSLARTTPARHDGAPSAAILTCALIDRILLSRRPAARYLSSVVPSLSLLVSANVIALPR